MKLRAGMAVLILATTLSAGQNVEVFVNNGETVPFRVIALAEPLTSRILGTADVVVHWHGAMRPEWKGNNRVILLDLGSNSPEGACSRDALGYSLLHERDRISIVYKRVLEIDGERVAPIILAHVMAHEIAHLLQGVSRHSAEGVMKAHWDWRDISNMRHNPLRFTAEDIRMIRNVREFSYLSAGKVH